MNLKTQFQEIKYTIIGEKDKFISVLLIVLVGFGGYFIGRLESLQSHDKETDVNVILENKDSSVVASVNGMTYHYPWCSGASRIKVENRVQFNSETEAKDAGYRPAKNCKGLK